MLDYNIDHIELTYILTFFQNLTEYTSFEKDQYFPLTILITEIWDITVLYRMVGLEYTFSTGKLCHKLNV